LARVVGEERVFHHEFCNLGGVLLLAGGVDD